jgi:hypothetical protein
MFKLDTAKNTFKGQRPRPKYSDDSDEEAFVKPKYTGLVFSVPSQNKEEKPDQKM